MNKNLKTFKRFYRNVFYPVCDFLSSGFRFFFLACSCASAVVHNIALIFLQKKKKNIKAQ